KAAEQLLNYVTDRREKIQYPKFQELGRQIGSGPTEAMCKATAQRVKGGGRGWGGGKAGSIQGPEALGPNGPWNDYWEAHLAQAVGPPKDLPHPPPVRAARRRGALYNVGASRCVQGCFRRTGTTPPLRL